MHADTCWHGEYQDACSLPDCFTCVAATVQLCSVPESGPHSITPTALQHAWVGNRVIRAGHHAMCECMGANGCSPYRAHAAPWRSGHAGGQAYDDPNDVHGPCSVGMGHMACELPRLWQGCNTECFQVIHGITSAASQWTGKNLHLHHVPDYILKTQRRQLRLDHLDNWIVFPPQPAAPTDSTSMRRHHLQRQWRSAPSVGYCPSFEGRKVDGDNAMHEG